MIPMDVRHADRDLLVHQASERPWGEDPGVFLFYLGPMEHLKWYLRFLLEVMTLVFIAWLGVDLLPGPRGVVLALSLVVSALLVWGIFNVPDDPSRNGKAPIPVSGWVRLFIEFLVFGTGIAGLWVAQGMAPALIWTLILILHQFQIKERNRWLVKH